MSENADKVKKKLEEVDGLVSNFGSQSEQLELSQKQLKAASKTLDEKTKEIVDIIKKYIANSEKWYKESEKWYDKTLGDVGDLVCDFSDSLESFNTVFNETKFGEVCKELSELAKLLEEYRKLKDDVLGMGEIVIEEVGKKIESEISSVREQQKENRKFFEEKFEELLSKVSPVPADDESKK